MYKDNELGKVVFDLPNGERLIEYSTAEVMLRPNTRPFFMFAASNSGKTVIAVDMYTKAMKMERFNQFQYITGNYSGDGNVYLRNKILKATCAIPTSYTEFMEQFYNLSQIIIQEEANKFENSDVINYAKTIAQSKGIQDIQNTLQKKYIQFKKYNDFTEIKKIVFNDSAVSSKLFLEIYKQDSFEKFISRFNECQSFFKKEIENEYELLVTYKKEEVSKQKALMNFISQVNKEYNIYKDLELALYKNIIRQELKTILSDETKKQKVLEYFQNLNNNEALPDQIKKVCKYVQNPFKACIIIDDVSDYVNAAQKSSTQVCGMKCKECFDLCMDALLTKGRHTGNYFIALHNPNQLSTAHRQQMGNIIVNTYASQWIQDYPSIVGSKEQKNMILQILQEFKTYQTNNGVRYNLVIFRDPAESPDGKSQFCLMNADYDFKQEFDTSSFVNNKYFKYLAEQQAKGITNEEDDI